MQVLSNRKVRARDTLRGALNLRVAPHDAVSQRCRQCGFMAFRSREQCPVCGLGNWPFAPLADRSGDAPPASAMPAAHPAQPVPTWSSRVAAAVRGAALRRPRASSAPLLSILTLVLMVGGYVTFDRMCRSDPVCRGQGAPGTATIDADAPALPVMPVPVHAFHPDDGSRAANDETALADTALPPRAADTSRRATAHSTAHVTERAPGRATTTTLARHAPPVRGPESARSGIRIADWKGGVPARRAHPVRRVSAHLRHGHRAAATEANTAMLYRGH